MPHHQSHPSIAILGAGYVGTEIARLAIAKGWRVSALTRNPMKADSLRALGCDTVVTADLAGDEWHAQFAGPYSFVVNCVSPGGAGIEGYRHSCVAGMESVGEWLGSQPPGSFVYTSSTGVYSQGGGAVVDESAPTEEGEGRGGLLCLAEQTLERAASNAGWRWFVLRLAGIYGPGRHRILDQVRAGVALTGNPACRLNLIHRDDICSAIFTCLESGGPVASSTFNVSDNAPHERSVVARWIADELGLPEPSFANERPTAGSPFGRRVTPDRVIVSNRIRSSLGWSPRHADFRSGFAELIAKG